MIRPPRPGELGALSALCLRSKAWWRHDAAFLAACRAELTLTAADIARHPAAVPEAEDRPVGVAQIAVAAETAELLKLFVEPDRIGSGIGRALFLRAAAVARTQGARRLAIEADPGAVPVYERIGARMVGQASSGSIPGRALPVLVLPLG